MIDFFLGGFSKNQKQVYRSLARFTFKNHALRKGIAMPAKVLDLIGTMSEFLPAIVLTSGFADSQSVLIGSA